MKRGLVIASFVFAIMLVSFSAAFWPFDEPREAPVDVGVTVGNEPPVINFMSSPAAAIPVGGGTVGVDFSFIVEDPNSASDIDTGSAIANYTGPGARESGPVIASCGSVSCADCSGNEVNMSCSGTMQYYHDGGAWDIAVSIKDSASNSAACDDPGNFACTLFTYGTVAQVSASPGAVDFPSISLTGTNQTTDDDPVTLTNEGNLDLAIDIIGYDLYGLTTPSDVIPSERFSTGGSTGTEEECDVSGSTGLSLGSNGTTVQDIPGISVLYGSSGNTDNMYFCLWDSLSGDGLSSQSYSTANLWSWEVIIG